MKQLYDLQGNAVCPADLLSFWLPRASCSAAQPELIR